MSDGVFPEHHLLRDAVELDTLLQTISSVDDGVWVGGVEPGQAGWQQAILILHQRSGRGVQRISA